MWPCALWGGGWWLNWTVSSLTCFVQCFSISIPPDTHSPTKTTLCAYSTLLGLGRVYHPYNTEKLSLLQYRTTRDATNPKRGRHSHRPIGSLVTGRPPTTWTVHWEKRRPVDGGSVYKVRLSPHYYTAPLALVIHSLWSSTDDVSWAPCHPCSYKTNLYYILLRYRLLLVIEILLSLFNWLLKWIPNKCLFMYLFNIYYVSNFRKIGIDFNKFKIIVLF